MSATAKDDPITLTKRGKTAIITLNQPSKLNALTGELYFQLATLLNEVAAMDDVYITVLTGTGRFFSAGADVTLPRTAPSTSIPRRHWLQSFAANNLFVTRSFYTHPKILVTALNGPAVGLSAALIAFSDFIYAAPHAFLLTPFTSLGLVAEGGASVAFVQRLGIAKANEALLMSRRIPCAELVSTGFVNGVFDVGAPSSASFSADFLAKVLAEVDERLGGHLNADSVLQVKALIRAPERGRLEKQGVAEVMAGLERFVEGVPQEEFRKIASGAKKHKL